MSISYIDGRYVRNLTEDTSQGAAKYENGDYTRAVVVGNYVQDGVTQSGALNGVPIEFMLDSINNQNIPVINILESHAAALAVLRSYGTDAHAYIPGVGVLNGLTAGNYTDTVGTQFTTKDQFVGLDLDAMGSLGAELAPAAVVSIAGTAPLATYNPSTGVGTVERIDASNQSYVRWTGLSTNTYRVTVTCTGGVPVSVRSGGQAGATVVSVTSPNTTTVHVVPGAAQISITSTGGASSFTVSSVKEVTGIHATQGTAGNKPVLRQGPVNLLLNSATLSTQSVAVAASPYTLSFTGTGTVTKSGTATGALVGTGATDRVTQTFTPTAGTLTLTVTGSVTSAQLQLGSTATTYIPTTSAKASAGTGPQYWEFGGDGTPTDYLGLGSVPFQMSDDFVIVTSIKSDINDATWRSVFTVSGAGNTPRIQIFVESGVLKAFFRSDAGVSVSLTSSVNIGGASAVICLLKIGTNVFLRVGGVQRASGSVSTLGASTFTGSDIGRMFNGSDYFGGNIFGVFPVKGTITDADLLLIEKLAANLAGVTL